MNGKIVLQIPPKRAGQFEGGVRSVPIKMALPFYKSKAGQYIHRVRSGHTHVWKDWPDRPGHISLTFWCGMSGFLDKGELFAEPPDRAVFCATCEGKAIGAGMDGARVICGRTVLFQPRL